MSQHPDREQELPPELRGAYDQSPSSTSSTPSWVRLTALLVIVAVVGAYVASYFF